MKAARFLMFILLLNLGCRPYRTVAVGDGGFISGIPCGASCFYDITPGITSEREFVTQYQTQMMFSSCREYDFSSSGGNRGFECPFGYITVNNGKVTGVGFSPSETIELQDAISKYGAPDRFVMFRANLPEYPTRTGLRLLYFQPCMNLYLKEQDGKSYEVKATSAIVQIDYSDESVCQSDPLRFLSIWHGFGSYEIQAP